MIFGNKDICRYKSVAVRALNFLYVILSFKIRFTVSLTSSWMSQLDNSVMDRYCTDYSCYKR